jgi:hypothetical protein
MIIASLQGTQLSPRQRLMLDQQRQVKAFMNPVLQQSIDDTLNAMEVRKKQGAELWVDPNKFNIVVLKSKGTPSMAEWMGN